MERIERDDRQRTGFPTFGRLRRSRHRSRLRRSRRRRRQAPARASRRRAETSGRRPEAAPEASRNSRTTRLAGLPLLEDASTRSGRDGTWAVGARSATVSRVRCKVDGRQGNQSTKQGGHDPRAGAPRPQRRAVEGRPLGCRGTAAAVALGAATAVSPLAGVGIAIMIGVAVATVLRPASILVILMLSVFVEIISVGGVTISRLIAPVALLVVLFELARGGAKLRPGPQLFWVGRLLAPRTGQRPLDRERLLHDVRARVVGDRSHLHALLRRPARVRAAAPQVALRPGARIAASSAPGRSPASRAGRSAHRQTACRAAERREESATRTSSPISSWSRCR